MVQVMYAAAKAGTKSGFISLEMTRDQIMRRLATIQTGLHPSRFRDAGTMKDSDWEHTVQQSQGVGGMGDLPIEIFDGSGLLIDYEHRILCLDETKEMQQKVKGERIALTPPPHADEYRPFTLPMIVAIRVSGISDRPLLLQLDSGIDVPLLFECGKQLPHLQAVRATRGHGDAEEVTQAFAVLMPQDVKVGGHWFRQISFVTPAASGREIPVKPDVDGVLPTILFRSAFISYADRFAVIQP
jgi:hypothetical protein